MTDPSARAAAPPDARVSTAWVAARLHDPDVRLLALEAARALGMPGRVPGTVDAAAARGLAELDGAGFAGRMRAIGARADTVLVLYGGDDDEPADAARRALAGLGHADVVVMEGGLARWIAEGRPLAVEVPRYPPSDYADPAQALAEGAAAARDERRA